MVVSLVIIGIFALFFFSIHFSHKRSQKIKIVNLLISADNKDKDVSFHQYHKDISSFFSCLLYKKETQNEILIFRPQTVHNMFLGKNIEIVKKPFFIEIKGPYNMIKVLARSLETPGSDLENSIKPL